MKGKIGLLGFGILAGLALVILIWQLAGAYTFQGSLIDPPVPAKDFELTQAGGQTFRLSDHRGQVVLIFFGYTHCPDVCPVTLSEFMQIKRKLGDTAEKVRFVFITVDPERDTPEVMADYIDNFDASFLGLTGDRVTLEKVWQDYGVYSEKVDSGSAAGYLVNHTARVYAVDRQGNLRLTYPFGTEIEKLIGDVKHLVAEKKG